MKKKELEKKIFKLADTLFFLLNFDKEPRIESKIINDITESKISNNKYLTYKCFRKNIQKQINQTKKKNYKKLYDCYKSRMLYFIHKTIRIYYS